MTDWSSITVPIGIALVLVTVVGGSLYGCQQADRAYYRGQRECIAAGGSWIPTQNYNAACVGGRR